MPTKTNRLKKDIPHKEKSKKKVKDFVEEKESFETSFSFRGIISFLKNEHFHKVIGLFLILFSFYLFVAFTSYMFTWRADDALCSGSLQSLFFNNSLSANNYMGKIGAIISYLFIKNWFGVASYLFILSFFLIGTKIFLNIRILPIGITLKYSFFLLIWLSLFFGYFFRSNEYLNLGGVFGFQLNSYLSEILGRTGTGILIFFVLISFVIISFNISMKQLKKSKLNSDTIEETKNEKTNTVIPKEQEEEEWSPDTNIVDYTISEKETSDTKDESLVNENILSTEPTEDTVVFKNNDNIEFTVEDTTKNDETIDTEEPPVLIKDFDPTLDLSSYIFPNLELLDDYGSASITVQKEELESNKNQIVRTLNNYSIQIEKIKATIGPTVTLYEIIPAPGVRISRIKNLEDDIALSLSALGIRIIAPIPGKGTIGIEVPNQRPEIVSIRSILSSDKFVNSTFDLPIGFGKTISNDCYVADLTKMPHLLVAGATNQGKSVGLNVIITSLLYKKHPSQLKFVLIDPKKIELSLYSKIERHFLAKIPDAEEAIITDTKKVVKTLNSLCMEMDLRYDLLKDAQVRNIKEYNAKFIMRKLNPQKGHKYLPYIVLIVDEFADLMITVGKEVELPITRLAQLARAVGLHLIVTTQRPSVNIITGTIKANFPARIAFLVTSKIDSRTILDSNGAEQLIGRGDMLLSTGNDLIRIQCAFVDTHEVEKIAEFIGSQRGYSEAFNLPEYVDDANENNVKNYDANEKDEFFEEAAYIIVTHQHGSTSLLQRKLKLGYNRAGRIVDQLEAAGIVGPFEGSKAREVKIKDLTSLENFLKNTNL